MCDKELIVSYLYDELQGSERKAFQHHLASCRDCQQEVQGLRATREHLVSWNPPEAALGFQIPAAGGSRPARRFWVSPVWGLAAAAALVLAVASAIANVEVKFADGGVTVRTGWAADPAASGPATVDAAARSDLAAIQQRVRELEAALQAQQTVSMQTAAASVTSGSSTSPQGLSPNRLSDDEVLRRVRQWIGESEQRQDRQFAARFVQGLREIQASHNMDLVRLEQAINQHQGVWSDEMVRQREEMKQVFRLVNAQR